MNNNNSKKSPLVVYYCDASYTGGAEKYLYYLAKFISSERFRTHVIFDQDSSADKFVSLLSDEGLPFTDLSETENNEKTKYSRLAGLFRKLKPDILHINLPGPFDAGYSLIAPLARIFRVKNIVSTEHLPMTSSFPKSRLLKGLGTRFINRVITVSYDNKMHIIRNHHIAESKIRVVYNGIPDPVNNIDFSPGSSRRNKWGKRFNLVIVGSLEERKGQADAVKLMKRLPDYVNLFIVGDGRAKNELKELCSKLRLEERVNFTGFIEDIFEFLSGMDIMIHPARIDATPYVILEAMAVGIPVVSSGIYGIPELVEDKKNGILTRPGDIDALAEAVMLLLNDRELYMDMSRSARERFLHKFTIENCINNTVNIYNDLLGSS